MPRPLVATIHLAALQHNLAVARKSAPSSKIWAVVKANAYGHGLARGMRAFSSADGLALIEVDGAVRLREMGWRKPVLLLEGFFDPADVPVLAAHQVQTAVHCVEQIEMLEQSPVRSPIDVYLKMNSGMNRLGFPPETYRAAYERLRATPMVRHIGLMTHFANADDVLNPGLPLEEQLRRFQRGTDGISGERSVANSAAVLTRPETASDWIRPGIMLYGGTPGGASAQEFGLRPAMTLTSEIIGMQEIDASEAVGYGSRFIADKPMKIGVVACGYADGYPRHAPNGTPVLVNGVKTRIAGRVSMDMLTVDLTDVPGSRIGSRVTLWGEGLPIDEVAGAAGTIGYELMCALAPRVKVIEQ
ncbi:alanine racemase [Noviherbaspirillum autotrophicum]|uniref:Alanine racemase n=1 Tax=Noviherbaspirillum autotrophicum TaxID=709839 RepID=A0A0C2BF53_9BURK|nr:alanine racemase [Noviherbaspirillum autotrophicum]KIF79860.1 alanine racemase [Noviherbaspirillum autotrophicum]